MNTAKLEFEDKNIVLKFKTYFNQSKELVFNRDFSLFYRLGGTAINTLSEYEGIITNFNTFTFKAFKNEIDTFEGNGILSCEEWNKEVDRHCWIYEYYTLDAENKEHSWLICKNRLTNINTIFLNIDGIDGGSNIIERYRVCPFFGNYKWLTL